MKRTNTARLATLALLAAMSVILIYLIRFPIFAAAPYLEYDPADIPLMIAGFMYGPVWGIAVTVVAAGIQALTVSAGSGIIGFCMHALATGIYVLVSALFYMKSKKRLSDTIIALILGLIAAVAAMIPLNLIFTPMYGTPIEMVKSIMWPIIVPFNLIKFSINSAVTAILYRSLGVIIRARKQK